LKWHQTLGEISFDAAAEFFCARLNLFWGPFMLMSDIYILIGVFAACYLLYATAVALFGRAYEPSDLRYESANGTKRPGRWIFQVGNDLLWFFLGTLVSVFTPEIREIIMDAVRFILRIVQ
jgi:hypothetical protein